MSSLGESPNYCCSSSHCIGKYFLGFSFIIHPSSCLLVCFSNSIKCNQHGFWLFVVVYLLLSYFFIFLQTSTYIPVLLHLTCSASWQFHSVYEFKDNSYKSSSSHLCVPWPFVSCPNFLTKIDHDDIRLVHKYGVSNNYCPDTTAVVAWA